MTIRDVAGEARLSRTTVSMALRNHPLISQATREHVKEVADRMGYRPDPRLRELGMHLQQCHRSPGRAVLAHIDFRCENKKPSDESTPDQLIEAIRDRAGELGYDVDVFFAGRDGMTDRRLSQILRARGIRGVLVGVAQTPGRVLDLRWDFFAGILLSQSVVAPALDRVASHHVHNTEMAVQRLMRYGSRRIGFALYERADLRTERQSHAGFLLEQTKWPKRDRIPVLTSGSEGFNKTDFMKWINRHQPDTLLLPSPRNSVLAWLKEERVRVPEDMEVAFLDVPSPDCGLSGVYQNGLHRACCAVELLVAKLQAHNVGIPQWPVTLMCDGLWVDGTTTVDRSGR